MRTPLPLLRLLTALGLLLTLTATACGDDAPNAAPDPTPSTSSIPTSVPEDTDLDDCELAEGPTVAAGVLSRITGGIAGIDESTFVPATCAADPIPTLGVDWDAVEVVETETDCEDCADAMSGATSEPVEVEGELVPVEEVDLAPGETLFAGDLVLVVTHIQPIS